MFPISHSITVNEAIIAYATGFFHIFNNFLIFINPNIVTNYVKYFYELYIA